MVYFVYKPLSWYEDNLLVIYDIFLSSDGCRLYIMYNTVLNILYSSNISLSKRVKKYMSSFIGVMGISECKYINYDLDVGVEREYWIEGDDMYKMTYVIDLDRSVSNVRVRVSIGDKSKSFDVVNRDVGKYRLGAVLMFRDENEYMDKWMDYYSRIGVDIFLVYNNNSLDKRYYDCISEKYNVMFIDWDYGYDYPEGQAQIACYNHALNMCKGYDYLLYMDLDEYILMRDGSMSILDMMEKYKNSVLCKLSSVMFECKWFGCGRNVEYNESNFLDRLVYSQCGSVNKLEKNNKTKVNGKCIHIPSNVDIVGVHMPIEYNGGFKWLSPSEVIYNHYYSISSWGRDRYFTILWDRDSKSVYRRKCRCVEICRERNEELLRFMGLIGMR